MTAHGSNASQGSHALESLVAYLTGAVIWPWGPPILTGLAFNAIFTIGKEVPQMYDKGFEGIEGDKIDIAVHIGTSLLAAGIHLLVV